MNESTNSPKISIIVPVYNCGKGSIIPNLVNNVLEQTEQSWELLLCDDGSTDNTLEICKKILECDKRIKVIENPHGGVSATRNSGIKVAQGEWITFVDADDHITGCFLESMLLAADRDKDVDMICSSYLILCNNSSEAHLYSDNVYKGKNKIKKLFEESDFLKRCSPWARFFKRSTITDNRISFNENLSHSEDRLFVYTYLLYTKGITTTSVIGYIYESFSSSSLKHKIHPFDMLLSRQKELTVASAAVMSSYDIDTGLSYHFVNNLLNLLLDAAQTLNRQGLSNKELSSKQEQLVETISIMYPQLSKDKKLINRLRHDKNLSYLISKDFKKFNRHQLWGYYSLMAKLFVRKALHIKFKTSSYKDYIHEINKL